MKLWAQLSIVETVGAVSALKFLGCQGLGSETRSIRCSSKLATFDPISNNNKVIVPYIMLVWRIAPKGRMQFAIPLLWCGVFFRLVACVDVSYAGRRHLVLNTRNINEIYVHIPSQPTMPRDSDNGLIRVVIYYCVDLTSCRLRWPGLPPVRSSSK